MAKKEDEKKKTVAKKTKKAASVKKTTKVAKKTGSIFAPWPDSPVKFRFYDIIAKMLCQFKREDKKIIILPVLAVSTLVALWFISLLFIIPITNTMTDAAGLTDYEGYTKGYRLWRASGAPTMKVLRDSYFDAYDVPDTHDTVDDTVKKVEKIVYWLLFLLILVFFRFQSKKARKYRKLMKIEN